MKVKFGLVELAFGENALDDGIDVRPDTGRRGIRQRPAGGLHGVCQHEDGGFLGLGPGTGIAETDSARPLAHIDGLLVEVADDAGPVMLADDVDDLLPQLVALGQFRTPS